MTTFLRDLFITVAFKAEHCGRILDEDLGLAHLVHLHRVTRHTTQAHTRTRGLMPMSPRSCTVPSRALPLQRGYVVGDSSLYRQKKLSTVSRKQKPARRTRTFSTSPRYLICRCNEGHQAVD
jgi:hypothetical protein